MHLNRKLYETKKRFFEQWINPLRVRRKTKIFCIGRNKTGTTSLKRAFQSLNIVVGNQRQAEQLLRDYQNGKFDRIIEYCKTAQFFQDAPFSYPDTFKHLDVAYPGSKFILTVRNNPEQWYNSVTKFHAKLFAEGNLPTKADLLSAEYVWKGWMWEANRAIYNTPENDPYNKEILTAAYTKHNEEVIEYFKDRPNDLIVVNVSDKSSYKKLMDFLKIQSPFNDFPWENQTEKLQISKK